jgi:hypothetical protein
VGRGNRGCRVRGGLGVSGIRTCYRAYRLECLCARSRRPLRLLSELLCLASAEEFERGFDAFLLARVSVGEELVDLEPPKFSAAHVAGGMCAEP